MVQPYKGRNRGEDLQTAISFTNTNAPVKISMSGAHPMKVKEEGEQFPFRIHFDNVGSGIPITDDVDGRVEGRVWIQGPAKFADCLGQTDTTLIDVTGDMIKLRRGESVKKACTIEIDGWNNAPEDTVSLIFELNYDYYTEDSVTVTVVGITGE